MKKLTLILLSVLMIVTLAACGNKCDHTYDNACDATCNECGETREVGAHDFADADCDTAKTCKTCGATEGSALGHEWTTPDVDLCEVQSTCSRCGATDGENKEHAPAEDDGDCTTAITCSVCGTVTTPARDNHTGGTSTCLGYQCDVCGKWYGDKTPDNHVSEEFAYTVNEDVYTHRKAHKCCDVTVIEAEAHDFVFETGKCKLCDAQAVAELFDYFNSTNVGYYFTMADAFEAIPDDDNLYAVCALADYDADFTIPDNLFTFFGASDRAPAGYTNYVVHSFGGTVINESMISDGIFNGKVINQSDIIGGTDCIFNCEVINEGTIQGGTFNGEVTNTGTIIIGIFNGCIINNGHIRNDRYNGMLTLGENFSIVNNGTIDCKYHIYKDGVCRLCAYECDHSGTAHTTATDNGDGTHGFTCTVCGGYGTEDHKGGNATCVAQAVCTICGNGYGELAPNNHASTEFTYTDNGDGTHSSVCQYCGYVDTTTTEEHIYYIDENCKCSECGAEHYLPFVEEGDCLCDYCFEYIHNPGENCVCTICSIPVHTIDSTTGICSDCNTFVAAASITVDDVKTYYATFDEAIAYANGQNSTVIVIENDCDVMDWSTKFSSGSITIDLNGKTIGSHSGYSIPIKGATVTIRDSVGGGKTLETVGGWSGTLIIEGGTHSSANNPENLIITGGNFTHVCVNTGKTTISGGSFETISIHKNTGTFTDILADGYCFYDKDGKAVDASTIQTDEYGWYYLYNVTVGAIK